MNIMIVEDESSLRDLAVECIDNFFDRRGEEANIYPAKNDVEAKQIIDEKSIDFVLMDMILMGEDGKTVDVRKLIKYIKGKNSNIKVVAVTGEVDRRVIDVCLQEKIIDVLRYKPVFYDEVIKNNCIGEN